MKKKKIIVLIIIALIVGLFLFKIFYLNNTDSIINYEKSDVDWSKYENYSINLNNEDVSITNKGVYVIGGSIENGIVVVDTTENVKLVLNGVNINNDNGSAIYVKNAKNTYIELQEGTINYLSDGNNYTDESINGTIYSHDDLFLLGTGKLIINANFQDAIVSKDDLVIISGDYEITSNDDGIRGKDSVVIYNGNIVINSSGDGIKSTNDTDENKGYIVIENGTITINSSLDGIQSETSINIKNGTFNITTGGGSNITSSNNSWGYWNNSTTTESAKGIKVSKTINIESGLFNINSSDDSIHSNSDLTINNGTFNISSGDDGIHADNSITINNGNINIEKSYEGIESSTITINDGNIKIVSSDDGINAAGGNDNSSTNGRPGQNGFSSGNSKIVINGGIIYVNASGDGVDANGSISMTNGTVVVNGPTDNGNGALDYDSSFKITGGTFIASGSSGMAQMPSDASINCIMINLSTISANGLISIKDNSDNEIFTYSSSKSYNNIVICSSDFKSNETYKIYNGGTESKTNNLGIYELGGYTAGTLHTSFTISSTLTTVGSSMGGGMNNMGRR